MTFKARKQNKVPSLTVCKSCTVGLHSLALCVLRGCCLIVSVYTSSGVWRGEGSEQVGQDAVQLLLLSQEGCGPLSW